MAEGLSMVPRYDRQSPAELAAMMRDSEPKLLFVSDRALGELATQAWSSDASSAPRRVLFDEVLQQQPVLAQAISDTPNPRADADLVTTISTSRTSAEPQR